jgi:hypothetical protein
MSEEKKNSIDIKLDGNGCGCLVVIIIIGLIVTALIIK